MTTFEPPPGLGAGETPLGPTNNEEGQFSGEEVGTLSNGSSSGHDVAATNGTTSAFNDGSHVGGTTGIFDDGSHIGGTKGVFNDGSHVGGMKLEVQGSMQITNMPCGTWKQCFPPGFGDEDPGCEWDEAEPAMVHLGPNANGTRQKGDPAYVDSQKAAGVDDVHNPFIEGVSAESDRLLLTSENARLAMENEMLRSVVHGRLGRENMQLPWGVEGPQAAYWADSAGSGYPMCYDASMTFMQPYMAHPWGSMGMMPNGMPACGDWSWNRVSETGTTAEQRATRARTDSDLPAVRPRLNQEADAMRARTLSADHADAADSGGELPADGPRTTVMLRNLPNNYTRSMLLRLLDEEGFVGQYDFVYLPMDFKTHASLGYAFVNLTSTEQATAFWKKFEGFNKWVVSSQKVCSVSWSCPYQGLDAHIDRYRNSPVMHEDVPDEYKPMVFHNSVRGVFPAPTKKLKAPRIRLCRDDASQPAPGTAEED
mmetsp:Transcript_10652/g.20664  ORF Transcript_10652/g.20664 Transcript_10652/m.20664 type:complete len:482 (+) Transcript_10652:152-1597(+)|eukprot:CAMPEP_0172727100 /NCGR_PEP_ID=MMETSP1074-20121228/91488_1 /TAXON_ID=2916 /ORGANISM="Ceratium fusus, Strain PA161109" /LENGTH=481 /DNA_ID=CAMNT_0013554215 /DNA_START=162 /DNA_END=1607 /DNA_ORIENTATION=+